VMSSSGEKTLVSWGIIPLDTANMEVKRPR
jgi:hypothetical protein